MKLTTDNTAVTLNPYRRNVYSQAGEDGIIGYLCERLALKRGWCVEFGAWDGMHLSNTRRLITEEGWSAVLVEGNKERFEQLRLTYKGLENVHSIYAFISAKKNDVKSLDSLLNTTPIPKEFDLLSIDVDGNDYNIWDSVKEYKAKIVIVEANSSYDYFVDKVNPIDSGGGASAAAMVRLGREKGYELVAHTGNCIFIRRDLFQKVGLPKNELKLLFDGKFVRRPWWRYYYRKITSLLCNQASFP